MKVILALFLAAVTLAPSYAQHLRHLDPSTFSVAICQKMCVDKKKNGDFDDSGSDDIDDKEEFKRCKKGCIGNKNTIPPELANCIAHAKDGKGACKDADDKWPQAFCCCCDKFKDNGYCKYFNRSPTHDYYCD